MHKYSCAWTSSAGGAVSEVDVSLKAGQIVQVICSPGGTAPTNDYDVTLTQEDGEDDLLGGGGTDCSSTLTKVVGVDRANLPVWIPAGNYWPTVANGGNAKTGIIDIYVI